MNAKSVFTLPPLVACYVMSGVNVLTDYGCRFFFYLHTVQQSLCGVIP